MSTIFDVSFCIHRDPIYTNSKKLTSLAMWDNPYEFYL